MKLKHPFPFDPTGGWSPQKLRLTPPISPDPHDFDLFWRQTYEWASGKSLDWQVEEEAFDAEGYHVTRISFAGMLGNRVGGWMTRPANHAVERGFVWLHGYGGLQSPRLDFPVRNAVTIQPCATGLPDFSLVPGIPSDPSHHVLHGIESRETYIHRVNVCDVWRAIAVLEAATPEPLARMDLIGESFGGGIGMLALPWENRIRSAQLLVPSFGHHELRLGLASVGSGEAVREHCLSHPEAIEVIQYFDAARAAARVNVPVMIVAALFDPAVPPAGQFAIHNALRSSARLFELTAGHWSWPGERNEQERLAQETRSFFA